MLRNLIFLVACSNATACAVTTVRTGDPIALASGVPSTPCEKASALEVAPTKVFAKGEDEIGMRGPYIVSIVHEQEIEGLGIYRAADRKLIELPDILPKLGNQALEHQHMARVQPINDKLDRGLNWFLFMALGTSSLLTAGSILAAIGLDDEESNTVAIIGASLIGGALVPLVVGAVATLANTPTGQERIYRDVRSRLFLDGEDDLAEVVESVDAFNLRVRGACAAIQ